MNPQALPGPKAGSTIRVLLLDDDEDDILLTQAMLEEIPDGLFEIDSWTDAETALEAIMEGRHDVYIIDYRFGPGNGLELIESAVQQAFKAPLILLTGQGDRRVDVLAMSVGAVDFLSKKDLTGDLLDRSIRYAIQRKKVEADLAEMRRRVADSGEAQRNHLARELHDGPLQDLVGARLHLSSAARGFEGADRGAIDAIDEIMVRAIRQLREICGTLRPPALAPFGLQKAILSHARGFAEIHPEIRISLDIDDDGLSLPEDFRLALFRIYQHALSNALQHAEAREVDVALRLSEGRVKLEIRDDGKGFEPPVSLVALARDGHYGLLGAKERAESIGGHLELSSRPGAGTQVLMVAPRPAGSPSPAWGDSAITAGRGMGDG